MGFFKQYISFDFFTFWNFLVHLSDPVFKRFISQNHAHKKKGSNTCLELICQHNEHSAILFIIRVYCIATIFFFFFFTGWIQEKRRTCWNLGRQRHPVDVLYNKKHIR